MTDAGEALLMGRVAKPHGLRGEFKVVPETDDPARLVALRTVFVGPSAKEARPFRVVSARCQHTRRGDTILLELEGVHSVEAAASLARFGVYALPDDLPPLAGDEFFLHDLIGLGVCTDDGAEVGAVRDILEMPASNVYVVARPGRPDALIPAVPAFVKRVDVAASRLVVSPIDGLLD